MSSTPTPARWLAPAKINLFLHVFDQRADGYHELQTGFQLLSYGDELQFDVRDDGQIQRQYDYGFSEQQDLCLRAAHLLKNQMGRTHQHLGVNIKLQKRLPMGGGLGGGSSDAATVLIALNHLWQADFTRAQLQQLSTRLGADVPVFVFGRPAWAEGIGDQLVYWPVTDAWYLVCVPEVEISTAAIFSHKQLTARQQRKKIRAPRLDDPLIWGQNDLENIVCAEFEQVRVLMQWLAKFGQPRMCGSGGSVFLPLKSKQNGLEILSQAPGQVEGFVTQSLSEHPHYRLLQTA